MGATGGPTGGASDGTSDQTGRRVGGDAERRPAIRLSARLEIVLGVGFWIVAGITAAVRGTFGAFLPYGALTTAALGAWFLVRRRPWAGRVLDWLPFPLVLLTYDMLHAVVPASWETRIDPWIRSMDHAVFGRDLAEITTPAVSPAVAWTLAACYAFYYAAPLSLGIWWSLRDRRAFRELMLGQTGCLFIGYLGYLLLPCVGPQAHVAAYATPVPGDWIGPLIRARNEGHGGHFPCDAFPSLHTANAVTLLLMGWRHERRTLFVYAVPMLGLIAATMLLRYHWATDVAAGALLAIAFQPVAIWWVRREMPRV